MSTMAPVQDELKTIIAELPLMVRDPALSMQLSKLRRLESRLQAPSIVSLDRAAAIPVASPAAGAIAGPAAVSVSLGAVVAVVLAIAAIALLINLLRDPDRAIRTLGNLIQRAIDKVVAAREIVRKLAQAHPRSAFCIIHFEPILQILGKMAMRLNAPVRGRPLLQGLVALAEELRDALKILLNCLDPADTLGLIDKFFGPNGLITEALAQVKALVR